MGYYGQCRNMFTNIGDIAEALIRSSYRPESLAPFRDIISNLGLDALTLQVVGDPLYEYIWDDPAIRRRYKLAMQIQQDTNAYCYPFNLGLTPFITAPAIESNPTGFVAQDQRDRQQNALLHNVITNTATCTGYWRYQVRSNSSTTTNRTMSEAQSSASQSRTTSANREGHEVWTL